MKQTQKPALSVFFIVGLSFIAIGVVNPVFFPIGIAFMVIGLGVMLRERKKNEQPDTENDAETIEPQDELPVDEGSSEENE